MDFIVRAVAEDNRTMEELMEAKITVSNMSAGAILSFLALYISKNLNVQLAADISTISLALTVCLLIYTLPPIQRQLSLALTLDRALTIGAITVAGGIATVIIAVFSMAVAVGFAGAALVILGKIVSSK